jgi:hypothetical protein
MGAYPLINTDFVTNGFPDGLVEFLRNPSGNVNGGHSSGLGAADEPAYAPSCVYTHFRDLGCLAGTRFSGYYNNLPLPNGFYNFTFFRDYGKL